MDFHFSYTVKVQFGVRLESLEIVLFFRMTGMWLSLGYWAGEMSLHTNPNFLVCRAPVSVHLIKWSTL